MHKAQRAHHDELPVAKAYRQPAAFYRVIIRLPCRPGTVGGQRL